MTVRLQGPHAASVLGVCSEEYRVSFVDQIYSDDEYAREFGRNATFGRTVPRSPSKILQGRPILYKGCVSQGWMTACNYAQRVRATHNSIQFLSHFLTCSSHPQQVDDSVNGQDHVRLCRLFQAV